MADIPDRVWLNGYQATALHAELPGVRDIEYRRVRKCVWYRASDIGTYKVCTGEVTVKTGSYCPRCGGEIEVKEPDNANE